MAENNESLFDAGVLSYKNSNDDIESGLCYRKATPHEGIKAGFGLKEIQISKALYKKIIENLLGSRELYRSTKLCILDVDFIFNNLFRKIRLCNPLASNIDNNAQRILCRRRRFLEYIKKLPDNDFYLIFNFEDGGMRITKEIISNINVENENLYKSSIIKKMIQYVKKIQRAWALQERQRAYNNLMSLFNALLTICDIMKSKIFKNSSCLIDILIENRRN